MYFIWIIIQVLECLNKIHLIAIHVLFPVAARSLNHLEFSVKAINKSQDTGGVLAHRFNCSNIITIQLNVVRSNIYLEVHCTTAH